MFEFEFEEEDFTTQHNGKTLLRILSTAKPHWRWLIGFLLAISLISILDSYSTFITKRIIDEGILASDKNALRELILLYLGIMLFSSLGIFTFIYLASMLGERIQYDLRQNTFNHLQELSLTYYDRTPVGWIMSRVTSDAARVAELVTWGLLDITWGTISIISSVTFMIIINWKLGLLVFTIIPLLLIIAGRFKKVIITEYRKVRKLNSKITGAFNENISGVRAVKALRREERNLEEFSKLSTKMFESGFRAAWLSALFLPVVQIISALGLGIVAWYGGLQSGLGELSIGGLSAFIAYITFMLWPIQDMARVYAEMQQAIASAERIFSLIDSHPEITDRPGAFDPGTLRGDIKFENVDFFYQEDKPVLKNFTLHVRQGETVALVGPTGGGKSTIVNLLCRFYEPKSGRIMIGDHDYTSVSLQSIQSRIGMVLQSPHLFSGSIRENIRYGRLDATDEDVEKAAILTGADEFINEQEGGYDGEVGEGGNLLSVGQKQLISLARAVLAEPDLFIMDEATSSVDTITESLIQKGLSVLLENRTSFIIAHRLSTIKRADRIILIDDGRITEMGSHSELLKKKGHYYRLYTQQFRKKLEDELDPFALTTAASD
ncbi:MAG: ABC transporter ATP-binding protein [Chloroflexi bacterium]|nr:ABC transporter ATP-binding protein [Chloroflexota bacterium]